MYNQTFLGNAWEVKTEAMAVKRNARRRRLAEALAMLKKSSKKSTNLRTSWVAPYPAAAPVANRYDII